MNKEKWDALPEDLQQVMTQSVRDFARVQVAALAEADAAAVAEAEAAGRSPSTTGPTRSAPSPRHRDGRMGKGRGQSPAAQQVYDALTAYLTEKGLVQ